MAKPLNFGRDINSFNAYAPQLADIKYNATLAATTETNITLPSTYENWIVFFKYQDDTVVWVDMTGATAAVPAGGTLAACTAELNPDQRTVPAGTKISMVTSTTTANVYLQAFPQQYI